MILLNNDDYMLAMLTVFILAPIQYNLKAHRKIGRLDNN